MIARTASWRATLETTRSIPTSRIAVLTSQPAISTWSPSSATGFERAGSATACSSSRSTPCCCASHVTARYIAPVSRYRKPRRSARRRATVLFPAPAGPSMATIIAPAERPRIGVTGNTAAPRFAGGRSGGRVPGGPLAQRDRVQHGEEVGEAYLGRFGPPDLDALSRHEPGDGREH